MPSSNCTPQRRIWSRLHPMKSGPYTQGETLVLVCTECKSKKVLKAVREEVRDQGLRKRVRVQKCGCLGACNNGPNVVVSNGKTVLYSGVTPEDAPTLVSAAHHSLKD